MPHRTKLLDDLGVVVVRFRDGVTFDDVKTAMDEVPAMPGFREGLKAVADFRDCTTALHSAEVKKLADYAKRADPAWGETKWALLAASDIIYGLSRMYMVYTAGYKVTTHAFRTAGDADDWLGIGVDVDDILKRAGNKIPENS